MWKLICIFSLYHGDILVWDCKPKYSLHNFPHSSKHAVSGAPLLLLFVQFPLQLYISMCQVWRCLRTRRISTIGRKVRPHQVIPHCIHILLKTLKRYVGLCGVCVSLPTQANPISLSVCRYRLLLIDSPLRTLHLQGVERYVTLFKSWSSTLGTATPTYSFIIKTWYRGPLCLHYRNPSTLHNMCLHIEWFLLNCTCCH